jgi:hypothetical protein
LSKNERKNVSAERFNHMQDGRTPAVAFKKAVEEAAWDSGHSGYTGTIAEKDSYTLIPVPPEWKGKEEQYADKLIQDGDDRIDDKWGPAGCLELPRKDGEPRCFLFFGFASS